MDRIKTVGLFDNDMVIVFDYSLEQVPHLQGHILEVGPSVLATADGDTEFLPSRGQFEWRMESAKKPDWLEEDYVGPTFFRS